MFLHLVLVFDILSSHVSPSLSASLVVSVSTYFCLNLNNVQVHETQGEVVELACKGGTHEEAPTHWWHISTTSHPTPPPLSLISVVFYSILPLQCSPLRPFMFHLSRVASHPVVPRYLFHAPRCSCASLFSLSACSYKFCSSSPLSVSNIVSSLRVLCSSRLSSLLHPSSSQCSQCSASPQRPDVGVCVVSICVGNLFFFLIPINMCAQQSVTAERNYYTKHGRTWGLKVKSARHPSSLPTLPVRRGLRAQQTHICNQHFNTQHGAKEANDA